MAQPHRLDAIDRKIIAALRRQPATTNKELAESLAVAEATIAARIRSLVERRVITVIAQRDIRALGYDVLAFACISVSGRRAEDVAADLSKIEAIGSVSLFAGTPEIIVEINARDRDDFTGILLDEIGAVAGVHAVETSIVSETVKYRSDIGAW